MECLFAQSIALLHSNQHWRDILTDIVHLIDVDRFFSVLPGVNETNLHKSFVHKCIDDRSVERPEPVLVLAFVLGVAYDQVVGHW